MKLRLDVNITSKLFCGLLHIRYIISIVFSLFCLNMQVHNQSRCYALEGSQCGKQIKGCKRATPARWEIGEFGNYIPEKKNLDEQQRATTDENDETGRTKYLSCGNTGFPKRVFSVWTNKRSNSN